MSTPIAPSRPSRRREGAVLVAAFALCLLGAVLRVDDAVGPPPIAAYLLAGVATAVLPLRHRAPLIALAVTIGCGVLVAPVGLLLTPLLVAPAVVAAYALALRADRRRAAAVLVPAAVLLVVPPPFFESSFSWADASRLVIVAGSPLVAALLGHAEQSRRAYLVAVEERAHRAETTRESEARRRVAEERVRIARELHDLVAHQITLANAQASVAVHVFESRPEQARTSLGQVVQTTRDALDELRATVGLLREADDAASVEPAPGLDRVPALLESFHRAGLEVQIRHEGSPRTLPPGLDLTAYRIIQEALTNVTKHAGTDAARVDLDWRGDLVSIAISDDGRGGQASTMVLEGLHSGYGLIGMGERASAVGGRVRSGDRPGGGFLVVAELPLPARAGGRTSRPADGDLA